MAGILAWPYSGNYILDKTSEIRLTLELEAAEPKTLQDAIVYLSDPVNCRTYLVARRWPMGVICPRCKPSHVDIPFFHEGQQLSRPSIKRQLPGHLLKGPGSLPGLILYDEWFAKYRRDWDGTLQGAVEIADNYILASSAPEAREIEKESSLAVGPNVHIATVTPQQGFRLIKEFKPQAVE